MASRPTIIDRTEGVDKQMATLASQARKAALDLLDFTAADRVRILEAIADELTHQRSSILRANEQDVTAMTESGLAAAIVDRLRLTPERYLGMVEGVRQIAALPDAVGKVLDVRTLTSGVRLKKVRVPMGVVLVIYESRPNVTADAAALCFKAGSAVILRGGSEAMHTNAAIERALRAGGERAGLPSGAIQLVPTTDRAAVSALLQMDSLIDLVIPRGGESLIRAVAEQSRVPVLKHYKGVCHVYVDRAADLEMALKIIENAKCQRPGVCNAAECLLVHRDVAERFLPAAAKVLGEHNVELRADERARTYMPSAKAVTGEDWSTEYLDLILSVGVVDSLADAVAHINTYGTRHSDAIVTGDTRAADEFTRHVDSATVYINASTRFTDGFEFGMGAEIGISTDKLHARGPCGLEELMTYKYILEGDGHVKA
jgi:glutamate-5-semialdehyde dehydrogenase